MTTTDRVLHLLIAFGPATVRDLSIVVERTPRMVRYALAELRAEGLVRCGDGRCWMAP